MDKDLEQKPQFSFFGFQHLLAGISEPRPVENRMWISENLIEMYFLNSLIRYCNYGWKSIVLKRLGASQSHLQISMLELVFLNQGFVDLTRKEISDPKINITNRSGIEFYVQRGPQISKFCILIFWILYGFCIIQATISEPTSDLKIKTEFCKLIRNIVFDHICHLKQLQV